LDARPNTKPELVLLTPEVVRHYSVSIINPKIQRSWFSSDDSRRHTRLVNRHFAEAMRIVTGFIEPHFFAGFSGGPKASCPAWRD
jgi:hypothetical protein